MCVRFCVTVNTAAPPSARMDTARSCALPVSVTYSMLSSAFMTSDVGRVKDATDPFCARQHHSTKP